MTSTHAPLPVASSHTIPTTAATSSEPDSASASSIREVSPMARILPDPRRRERERADRQEVRSSTAARKASRSSASAGCGRRVHGRGGSDAMRSTGLSRMPMPRLIASR